MIGRRVMVAGLPGVVRARWSLSVNPAWIVVLDGGWGNVVVTADEMETM
jgi:hypothetical protein